MNLCKGHLASDLVAIDERNFESLTCPHVKLPMLPMHSAMFSPDRLRLYSEASLWHLEDSRHGHFSSEDSRTDEPHTQVLAFFGFDPVIDGESHRTNSLIVHVHKLQRVGLLTDHLMHRHRSRVPNNLIVATADPNLDAFLGDA